MDIRFSVSVRCLDGFLLHQCCKQYRLSFHFYSLPNLSLLYSSDSGSHRVSHTRAPGNLFPVFFPHETSLSFLFSLKSATRALFVAAQTHKEHSGKKYFLHNYRLVWPLSRGTLDFEY